MGGGSQRPSIVGGRNNNNVGGSSVYFSAVTAMLTRTGGSQEASIHPRGSEGEASWRQRGSLGSEGSVGAGGGGDDRKGSLVSGTGSGRSRASSSAGLVPGGNAAIGGRLRKFG